ncbi:zinc finger, CCHC-type containing protein [Tanacetum coccineum]
MTTTVVNISVFRAFFEKQRLTGPNFIDWYHNLWIVLSVEDKLPFLEQPPIMPVPLVGQVLPPDVLATYSAWVKASKEIAGLMLMTMDPDIQKNLEQLGSYDMVKELKTLYAQQAEQELFQTVREFHACKQEEGQSVSSCVLKIKSYMDNLEHLGHAMTQNLVVSLILISLRKEYDSFVQNYYMHGMGKTMTGLHAMLKLHEKTLPKKDVAPALHAIRAGKIPPPSKKENPAKDAICHQCGGVGHWKRNCPQYLDELLKNKKLSPGASTSGIFTIELYTFPNNTWVYETGCGTYICITTQGLKGSRKLKPGALSLYVGDGHRAAVEAIGSYHLCLPSGLVLVLHNFHYAPSITRGIISVSRLYDGGFINHFENNTISVSKNNVIYFSVIPRNGIFETDLSNYNTNDSSMYFVSNKRAKTNLDSTLLWHYRLGHISKKRIEKLQHDGLLNSTKNQSFDKYVSCMSRKMARKPYTHQVERAKDLLGLIHTDDYAFESAARILNMVPTKKVKKTLYEIWHGQDPKLSYLKVWGYEALVKRDTLTKPDKLEPSSIKMLNFLENSLMTQEASGSLEDLKIIQEKDMHPSVNTSLDHDKDDQEIDELQSDINPIYRSTRTQHALDRMCLYIDVEEHELGDHNEPTNYKAALLDHKSEK